MVNVIIGEGRLHRRVGGMTVFSAHMIRDLKKAGYQRLYKADSPIGTIHPAKPSNDMTSCWTKSPGRRNLTPLPSGKSGPIFNSSTSRLDPILDTLFGT